MFFLELIIDQSTKKQKYKKWKTSYKTFLITTYRIWRGGTRNLSGEASWNKGKLTKTFISNTQTKGTLEKNFGILSARCSWNCILNDKFKLLGNFVFIFKQGQSKLTPPLVALLFHKDDEKVAILRFLVLKE